MGEELSWSGDEAPSLSQWVGFYLDAVIAEVEWPL